MAELIHSEITYGIIGACLKVYNTLGYGFLEKVYKDALEKEMNWAGLKCEREVRYEVWYKGHKLKHDFYADFTVGNKVILEVKSVEVVHDTFIAQTLNYLKVSGCRVGLLVNFAPSSLQHKRLVL